MLRVLILCLLAYAAAQCSDPLQSYECVEGAGSVVELESAYGPAPCTNTFTASSCASAQQQLYEFDLLASLDFTATAECSVVLSTDSVPLDGAATCTVGACDGTKSARCGYIALGGLTVEFSVQNVRYEKQLILVGSFPYDYVTVTQFEQYSDLQNPAGAASPFECITACFNGSGVVCDFRASDTNGSYCYNENTDDFASGFGPSSFNCVSVQQPVFVPHTPDLTQSCCGDCENCACALGDSPSSPEYVAYFPQTSPLEAYGLFIGSTGGGFMLDADTGGRANSTYNTDTPMFIGALGWPLVPESPDQSYYSQLTACPPTDTQCLYGQGLWLPALRRDPLTQQGYASDVDGKLACGYCTQGMPALRACGDPAVPALIAVQSYVMGMSPTCRLWSASDDSTLKFDVVVTVTGNTGTVTTASFLDLSLDNQEIIVSNDDATIFVTIDANIEQSALDDPLITDSFFATCAPDASGDDLYPLDPSTWGSDLSPWSNRLGPITGQPNCYGCMPDDQSSVPGEIRLWWYMNATQAAAFVDLTNVGAVNKVGVTNRIVQQDDCDNLYGNFSGCAPGTAPGLQSNACAAGGMAALLPSVTAAQVARAFNNYRQLLAAASTTAYGPLGTEAGAYLPPSWTFEAPNYWIEAQGDMVSIVYQPITSPFENTVAQQWDASVYVDTRLAAAPQPTPPVVIVDGTNELYTCALVNQFPPRLAVGSADVQIDPAYAPSAFALTYYVSAQAGPVSCLVNGEYELAIVLQADPVTLQLQCDASDLDAAVDGAQLFTLQVTRGSIVSMFYQTFVCPGTVATDIDPALGYAPDPPPADTGMLNTTLGPPVVNDNGVGTPVDLAGQLYKADRAGIAVWTAITAGVLVLAAIITIGFALYPIISNEIKMRRLERGGR